MVKAINNSANLTYRYGTITDSINSNVVTTLLNENYSLNVEKTTHNLNWRPSENLTFGIRIENSGTEPIFAVSVQDNLGGDTTRLLNYIIGSAKILKNGVLSEITPTSVAPLTMAIPDTLKSGEVVVLSYVAKVIGDINTDITEITNTATVVGHETSISGPTVTVNSSSSVTIPKANYADVRIKKSVDKGQISAGDTLTYIFQLENYGNVEATNIVIEDNLPEEFVIESIGVKTNGVQTTFETTDYSLDADNKLILPTSIIKTISVPAASETDVGRTIVTIIGSIGE